MTAIAKDIAVAAAGALFGPYLFLGLCSIIDPRARYGRAWRFSLPIVAALSAGTAVWWWG